MANLMGQMQKALQGRHQGALPRNIIPNPREEIKAITTRSGIVLPKPSVPLPPLFSSSNEVERDPKTITDQEKLQGKFDIQVHKFFQMFKKLHFNISLTEALAFLPKYHKMLKDILSDKEKLLGLANISLTKNCSAVLLKKLPEKLGDPGKFLIPCDFLELKKYMALANLGTNINLMPLCWENRFTKLSLASQILNQGPTSGIRAFRGTLRKKNQHNHKQQTTLSYKMSQPANDDFSQHLSDGEESNHEDASDTGAAPKQPQQMIPQTTAISNIKLPILKKEEYDIWAMEMEHYLEYIDNEVWKVIQNGNSKKRISTRKDGVIRVLSPVTAVEIQAVEKERKAKNILLMAIPKEHMRRFHGMDDAKEIWEAIRTRFGEGLEKGYDRFQQLLSQLEAHGAEVSTEDANHKFLRSLPPAWSNLAMTMRTNPEFENLSIDDLYNNLRVFEQKIQGASKTSSSAQNVAFVSQSKSSTNKVKSGFTGAYSTYIPSTSSTNTPKKEVLVGFADEVIYSLFAKQSEDWDYFMKFGTE
ncbi:hypothetical protein Tco_0724446 [Tanacetum coccineum]